MNTPLRLILAPTLFSLLALSGCDEAAPLDLDDAQLRGAVVKVVYQTPQAKGFKADILPPPDDPGGDGPCGGGGPFDDVTRNAAAIYASAYEHSLEAKEFCPDACKEADMLWEGEVTAQGEFQAGEPEWMETEEGELFVQAEIHGEVAMGCVCQ